jgi:hypothetical protein
MVKSLRKEAVLKVVIVNIPIVIGKKQSIKFKLLINRLLRN